MTYLFGVSDDLFYTEGEINSEFYCWQIIVKFECSDGTKGVAKFFPSGWRIICTMKGSLFLSQTLANPPFSEKCENKRVPLDSDYIILKNGLEWININGRIFWP